MDNVTIADFFALSLTLLGTVTAAKAKRDLGICHTWTGYCKESSSLRADGIYAYVRHPLYTGIYLFIMGGLSTIIIHSPWYLTTVVIGMVIFIMSFLAIAASKETNYLRNNLGKDFENYLEQVHPFLPLKKYNS